MATSSTQDQLHPRTIPLESILAARQRVYQAAVRTPLVRLYYDDVPARYISSSNHSNRSARSRSVAPTTPSPY